MTVTIPTARTTNELISQMPGNAQQLSLTLKKLGLWTNRSHNSIDERRTFPRNLASLSPDELADTNAYWSSEAGRITELHGILQATKVNTDLEVKIASAVARTAVRTANAGKVTADGKPVKMASAEINDAAEAEQSLKDAREKAVLVESVMAAVGATKEATLLYLNTLSREITRRGDLMKHRL